MRHSRERMQKFIQRCSLHLNSAIFKKQLNVNKLYYEYNTSVSVWQLHLNL